MTSFSRNDFLSDICHNISNGVISTIAQVGKPTALWTALDNFQYLNFRFHIKTYNFSYCSKIEFNLFYISYKNSERSRGKKLKNLGRFIKQTMYSQKLSNEEKGQQEKFWF